jgi:hypothetical protein
LDGAEPVAQAIGLNADVSPAARTFTVTIKACVICASP